jgi:arylsulfatase A-like enzyme
MMEVFAAFGAHTDYEMGRIVDAVKKLPGGDNTVFIYIAGDNGASAEAVSKDRSTKTFSSTASPRSGRTTSKRSMNSADRSISTTSPRPGPMR